MVDHERGGKDSARRPGQRGHSKKKYMDMLQKVADRQRSEVTIELDDLENVGFPFRFQSISDHLLI